MRYLEGSFTLPAYPEHHEKRAQIRETGGPAMDIPADDRCPSGLHNTKLTQCWCTEAPNCQ